ncbi:MAG: cyclase family protein [Armatimonadetes bacterium]|nr:cyclase family protein [Anaerolineae bacterium]
MCSPEVAKIVQQRIANDGAPKVSRRNLLKLSGVLAAAAGTAALPGAVFAKPARQMTMPAVVDLSHVLSPSFPVFPGFNNAVVEALVTVADNGFYAQQWTFGEHTSTHMDFPGHFVADAPLVDDLDAAVLVGSAVVIDISAKAATDPDALLDAADIEAWEAANGEIPAGAFVFMYSGWEAKLAEEGAFAGTDADGKLHFPGLSKDACELLVARGVHGAGVDTLSLDHGISTTFDAHYTLLGAGVLGVENVANLAAIIGKTATIVCGIPKYENGSGGPTRVLALVEEA